MAVGVAVAVATIAGEALLSASFQALFGKLGSPESLKFARQEKMDAELEKWKIILEDIFQVLEDAEDKQSTKPSVKRWLNDLKDLAYDVDDILDEINTEALRRKLTKDDEARPSKLPKLISSYFGGWNPKALLFNVTTMGPKIQEITARLEVIVSQKNRLGLKEDAGKRSGMVTERLPTTSLVNESLVYGRDQDKAAILELMKAEANDSQLSVIPIQGMGGVGKTTLAQLVYNETQVRFDLKAWVCVSDNFDIPSITKTVLQSVASETCDGKDLNWLQVKLKEKLTGKKFLIVLDDVWNEEYVNWTELRKPFEAGALGSKIIVTTRNLSVSSIMVSSPAAPVHRLKVLSQDECVSILAQHALGEENFARHPNLKAIGEEIARKCKGLPLAAKVIGGVLRAKQYDKWVDILHNNMWNEAGTILPALRLSYHHLPSQLKQCFAYCALFPKDYEFDRDELVLFWMAEGFLQQAEGNKQMETLGREYFDALWSRSFFQQISENEMRFVMHDLTHDLAEFVLGEICFHLDGKTKSVTSEKTRYSSFIRHQYEVSNRFEVYNKLKRLRTFVALPLGHYNSYYYISSKVLHDLLLELRCLRVLSLSNYQISELSNSIGELKHLRYLNLSSTSIKELPTSIGDLYNLQVLLLRGCNSLTKLPQRIGDLIHLRHLDIYSTISLLEMPLGIRCLKNLQKLSKFVVGKGDGLRLKNLKDLSHLQGELSIMGLDNVVDVQDARVANLKGKQGLKELSIYWGDNFNDISRNEKDEMYVMDMLEPCKTLEGLTIAFFGGREFSSWLSDPLFTKIVRLHIRGCEKITSLPSLGRLPSLKVLEIKSMGRVKSVGREFYKDAFDSVLPFSSLETLKFEDMLEWEEWSCSIDSNECKFPCLCELHIVNCPKLSGKLPSHLSSLTKLTICKCPILVLSPVILPSLCELNLEDCNANAVLRSMEDLSSLTKLTLERISDFTCFHEGLMQLLIALEVLEIKNCGEMTSLWQSKTEVENLACLKELTIFTCPRLVSLGGVPLSLKRLLIEDCEALELLPDSINNCILEYVNIVRCSSLKFLPSGKSVVIGNCKNLHSFSNERIVGNSHLERLSLFDCPSLTCFPTPTALKNLFIGNCPSLKFLASGKSGEIWICENLQSFSNERIVGNSHLEHLSLFDCPSLTCFPTPTALKNLYIHNCTQLEESVLKSTLLNNTSLEIIEISRWMKLNSIPDCLHSLIHLTSLKIVDCPALVSFPERGLLIPNLTSLMVRNCKSLKSLPNRMQNLISLQELYIWGCPNIMSIPEGGLPPNLISLQLYNCKNMKQPFSEWGLHRLTSLRELWITGRCDAFQDMVSFPDDEPDCTLPITLIHLSIRNFLNLEALSRGLQNLTSLQTLIVMDCPKLHSLPNESLPSTLGSLSIGRCPLLERRCLKGTGEYWHIIAHIPRVAINSNTQSGYCFQPIRKDVSITGHIQSGEMS